MHDAHDEDHAHRHGIAEARIEQDVTAASGTEMTRVTSWIVPPDSW